MTPRLRTTDDPDEITHVPAAIRDRDRQIGLGAPVLRRYERVTFDRSFTPGNGSFRRSQNLGVTHSKLLPSVNVLLPLIVLLGERPDESLDTATANGILYWFLVATIRNRYSGAADTLLGRQK